MPGAPTPIEDLRTFDEVRPIRLNRGYYVRGYVLVMLHGEPPEVLVQWRGRRERMRVDELVVMRKVRS